MRRLAQPDPEDVESQPVHCFGCGRQIGVAAQIKQAVYCEELCRYKPQLINFESAFRDRAVVYLVEHLGIPKIAVSRAFEMTPPRVLQVVVAQRNKLGYLQVGRSTPITAESRAKKTKAGRVTAKSRWGK